METKVKSRNFTKVVRSFQDWEHYVNYESHDRGRVWIMIMANGQWLAELPNSKVIFHPHDTSDHHPRVLRFFKIDIRNIPVQGTPMFTISKKLELLQLPLRKLNKEQPQNKNLYKEKKAATENVQAWKQRLESFYKQKSEEWLNLDDINRQYFYAKLKQRHHLNRIASYQIEDGQWTWSYDKVLAHFVNYYKNLLGTPVLTQDNINDSIIAMGPCVSISQQIRLVQPFKSEDVQKALFSIPSHKSPGLDGFNNGFFKSCWPTIGEDVCQVVMGVFRSGKLLQKWNGTRISLVPKTESPTTVAEYRPIACYNTLYKCISKLIYDRLRMVLPHTVNVSQSRFIEGRLIGHNTMTY
ncbi:hypothetical protein Cgig2_021296 [Carnegiea gigantea]|uniref:Reverse transcriptase domain-containing protein n=1 Tax=Carnegiea gigantea TaxID=171969 RepID=A0A9Q1K3U9_9CARY|nr:hypothetical protein Cgig2_021296 [Carnegiea gigantea]